MRRPRPACGAGRPGAFHASEEWSRGSSPRIASNAARAKATVFATTPTTSRDEA